MRVGRGRERRRDPLRRQLVALCASTTDAAIAASTASSVDCEVPDDLCDFLEEFGGPVTLSAVPPDAERTLRRTVTSACFVGRSPFVGRSSKGLLRFGVVTVVTVALYDLVCLRFGAVTVVLSLIHI